MIHCSRLLTNGRITSSLHSTECSCYVCYVGFSVPSISTTSLPEVSVHKPPLLSEPPTTCGRLSTIMKPSVQAPRHSMTVILPRDIHLSHQKLSSGSLDLLDAGVDLLGHVPQKNFVVRKSRNRQTPDCTNLVLLPLVCSQFAGIATFSLSSQYLDRIHQILH